MRPTLWTTLTAAGGAVSIAARPRPGNWLTDEMRALHAAGIDLLISALTDTETRELGLADEPAAAKAAGLHFAALPIPDLGVPADTASFLAALDQIAARVESGGHVAVHCRAGIGRSSLIAVLLLARAGWEPEAAITHLGTLRGVTVPETDQQRAWLITTTANWIRSARPTDGAS